jgi:hypothetical protein
MSENRALVALSAVLLLAMLSPVSAQIANDDPEGGFVVPGSKAGVNPAYHPEFFGHPPNYACFDRFETYDSASETYLGKDGRRRPCRLQPAWNGNPKRSKKN